jgi:hypothetical protein
MTQCGLRRSLGFDPQFLDDRPPFLGIGFPEGIRRFRGLALARIDLRAKIGQPRAHRLICQRLHGRRIELANNVPAVYVRSIYAREGGLLSYGIDYVDTFRRAASYVDRILRGEKPGDLPVQLPTKFEMVVNRKTATALGLSVPPSIMLRADEVIE